MRPMEKNGNRDANTYIYIYILTNNYIFQNILKWYYKLTEMDEASQNCVHNTLKWCQEPTQLYCDKIDA